VRSLAHTARVTNLHDRHENPAWGLHGGAAGAPGRIVLNPGTTRERELHSKDLLDVVQGDLISYQTCGGGGWGSPLARDPMRVLADVLAGCVTREGALREYGVVLTVADPPEVDAGGTARVRGDRAADSGTAPEGGSSASRA
jgi:N-methylhydantoinase B